MPLSPTNNTPLPHCGNAFLLENRGLVGSLIPGQFAGGQIATGAVFVNGFHRSRRDFRVGFRSLGFDSQRGIQFQRPKRQINPMAAQVGHGSVAEIPPAIPLRPRNVNRVERTKRSRADPQIPIEIGGRRHFFCRAVGDVNDVAVSLGLRFALKPPRPRDPNVNLADMPDGPGAGSVPPRGDSWACRGFACPFAWGRRLSRPLGLSRRAS